MPPEENNIKRMENAVTENTSSELGNTSGELGNYKIKVKNKKESKEVLGLFKELGVCERELYGRLPEWNDKYIFTRGVHIIGTDSKITFTNSKNQKITLSELRLMVENKRFKESSNIKALGDLKSHNDVLEQQAYTLRKHNNKLLKKLDEVRLERDNLKSRLNEYVGRSKENECLTVMNSLIARGVLKELFKCVPKSNPKSILQRLDILETKVGLKD